MGRESLCSGTWNGRAFGGKALFEGDAILVRAGGGRVEVPFSAITRIEAARGRLTLATADGILVLDLGDEAPRWADKIRNPPTLADKLGITAASRVSVVGIDDPALLDVVRSRAKAVTVGRLGGGSAIVIAGLNRSADLQRFEKLRAAIAPDGAVWTVRPKGVPEVSEAAVRAAAIAAGLVDVKVARVSATHTAEKFVIPKSSRVPKRHQS